MTTSTKWKLYVVCVSGECCRCRFCVHRGWNFSTRNLFHRPQLTADPPVGYANAARTINVWLKVSPFWPRLLCHGCYKHWRVTWKFSERRHFCLFGRDVKAYVIRRLVFRQSTCFSGAVKMPLSSSFCLILYSSVGSWEGIEPADDF